MKTVIDGAKELVSKLKAQNINFTLDGENLKVKAPKEALTPDLIKLIKDNKVQITELLKMQKEYEIFFKTIPQAENSNCYPISVAQRTMYVMSKLNPNSTAYNLTQVLKIDGDFDKNKFVDAFSVLSKRHESLRTSFELINGEPYAVVHETVDIKAENEEVFGDEEKINDEVQKFIRPYNMEEFPLFRLKTIKRTSKSGEVTSYVIIDMHHIISDGVSISIIVRELNAVFSNKELPKLKKKYCDYAAWNNKLLSSSIMKNEKDYWNSCFKDELPVLNLPTDFKRPEIFTFNGESVKAVIKKDSADKLNVFARKNKVTLFSLLLAAYYVLLYKYTGQTDIIIGTSLAGRHHDDLNDIVGVFVNTVAMRNFPKGDKKFTEFLAEIGENSLKAIDNQDYPFENLVEDLKLKRNLSRNPLFDSMFIMLDMKIDELKADGTAVTYFDYKKKMAQFDLEMNATETKNGIEIELCYCSDLFRKDTIETMVKHYINILEFAEKEPSTEISQIEMFDESDKKTFFEDFNDTDSPFSENCLINELVEKRAKKSANLTAVVYKENSLTYHELNKKADALACTLRKNGVKKDTIVGLMVKRSEKMIVAQLAILKSGGAYLPIDPDYPKERISYMLENSKTNIIISEKFFYSQLFSEENSNIKFIDINDENSYSIENDFKPADGDSDRLAYVIYTSGSTGKPKGVMIEHKSVVNFIESVNAKLKFKEGETIACLTTVSFDIFVLETLLPLVAGMKIVVAEEDAQRDAKKLSDLIKTNGIDSLQATPTRLMLLLNGTGDLNCFKSLKKVMVGGEAFPPTLFDKLRKYTNAEIINFYGPTETTVYSLVAKIESSDNVTIGKPISNTKVYILDKDCSPVPINAKGELYIGGVGLARGYFALEDLTKKKFVPDRFAKFGRMYSTGDVAKWNKDGTVSCLGRIDNQVKIRGFRVELGEIEKQLQKFDSIETCAVTARDDESGEKYLVAYYCAKSELSVSEMRKFLATTLPDYMVPETFVFLKKMPHTPNGKIDRNALPKPGTNRPKLTAEFKAADNDCEKKIAQIWQNVLKKDIVGVDDNFFDLGGNSLLLITMQSEVEKIYPGKISVTDIFSHPTISKMADILNGKNENSKRSDPKREKSLAKEVAIIGISGRFGFAKTPNAYYRALCEGKDFIRKLPKERKKDCDDYEKIMEQTGLRTEKAEYFDAAFLDKIDGFDCGYFGISPKEADLMSPEQRFFLERAFEAIEDAGYGNNRLRGTKTGVFVGYSNDLGVDYRHYGGMVSTVSDQVGFSGNIGSVIGARLSYILDLRGPSVMIDTACSSTMVALHTAVRSIQCGDCNAAIVGGCKISVVPEKNAQNASKLGYLSTSGRSNAFDASADGMGCGEGGGAVMLKPLCDAVHDNDNIYAVIKGTAMNQDGNSIGLTAPNVEAQKNVILDAWNDAGIDPLTISYIETHGTGTKLGDPIEISGITKAFEEFTDKKQFCGVASVKSNIGHLDVAAGIASLIKAVLCLKNRQLLPTIHFNNPNPKIDFNNSPVYVIDKLKKWEVKDTPRRCGISSFGLSGTNCHAILEEYIKKDKQKTSFGDFNIFTLSAKTQNALVTLSKNYLKFLKSGSDADLDSICFTQNSGRGHYNFRLAFKVSTKKELIFMLEKYLDEDYSQELYFGDYKLVSQKFADSKKNMFTREDILSISKEADKYVEELISESKCDSKKQLIDKICKLYVNGAEINWLKLYGENAFKKVSVPSYPFSDERHWVEKNRVIARPNEREKPQEKIISEKAPIKLEGRENGKYFETERKIADIFCEALGLKEINIYDDFFEMGGNSLVSIRVETMAQKENIAISSDNLYNFRTVETLAAFVDNRELGKTENIEKAGNSNFLVKKEVVEIKDIEPFNDVFYRSCFFNSFFPIVKHFQKSINPFLFNDFALFSNGEDGFSVEYRDCRTIEEILVENKIAVTKDVFHDNIISQIKSSVVEKNPVIIWVDCFYESIRKDMFKKKHWSHTILIYGYDDENEQFLIVEHKNKDNLFYEKRRLSYDDTFNMMRGYIENFGSNTNNWCFYSFSKEKGDNLNSTVEQNNFIQNSFLLKENLKLVRDFAAYYKKITQNSELFFKHADKIAVSLNNVINSKQAEIYKLKCLFPEKCLSESFEVMNLLKVLTEEWKSIRRTTVKSMYSGEFDKKSLDAASKKLDSLYFLELQYLETKLKLK